MGNDFTAKDFRTWGATLHAITLLACTPLPDSRSEHAFKKCIAAVVKQVAAQLRNTPAVCRKSYINPAIFDSWRLGHIQEKIDGKLTAASARKAETLVLAFLRQEGGGRRATDRAASDLQKLAAMDDGPMIS
jgi:DNA topoisomerase-1